MGPAPKAAAGVGVFAPEQPFDSDLKAKLPPQQSPKGMRSRTLYAPSCEEAIWHSEVRRKGALWDMGVPHVTRHVYLFKNRFFVSVCRSWMGPLHSSHQMRTLATSSSRRAGSLVLGRGKVWRSAFFPTIFSTVKVNRSNLRRVKLRGEARTRKRVRW